MKNIILFFLILSTLFSCRKSERWILPPNRFNFQIVKNGQHLDMNTYDSLKMFYIDDNGVKHYELSEEFDVNYFLEKPSTLSINDFYLDSLGVYSTNYVNDFGVQIHNWYIEFPDGDVDTLYVESKEYKLNKDGMKDDCYCQHPMSVVQYNGRDAHKHPTLKAGGKPIFVLEKL